jgi:N-acetylglucosaminyldiphosphoundecaprenol N-acetyl-beta-D-mannosaminyltransferase
VQIARQASPQASLLASPQGLILGTPVNALTLDGLLEAVDRWVKEGERHYICTLDVHALIEGLRAPDVQEIYRRASVVTPDGMPLVWLLRRAGFRHADRICGPDLMPALFGHSKAAGYRHYLYGSTTDTLELLTTTLNSKFPAAKIVGTYSPPFRALRDDEHEAIAARINEAAPDVVWVGLGAPKQDRWMGAYRRRLQAPVLIGVGGAFDMLAGKVRRAPRIIQRSGCEWAFRMVQEPRRLCRRYVESNARFAYLLLQEALRPPRNRRPA